MSSPRHLWSGDWEHDSAAARAELEQRRAQIDEPAGPPPATPSPRVRPSAAARAVAWLREAPARLRRLVARAIAALARNATGRRLRVALLVALAVSLTAGAAFGVTTLMAGSGNQPSAAASRVQSWLGIDVAGSPLGIVVTNVVPGSPAQAAGLEPGDLINQIDNQPVGTVDGVSAALGGLHPGDTIEIQFARGPVSYTTTATLSQPGSP